MPSLEELERRINRLEILLQAVYDNSEKTRKYILWGRIMSAVYLVLIFAPLIFAIIYIPPLIRDAVRPYQELLGTLGGLSGVGAKGQGREGVLSEAGNALNILSNLGVTVEQEPR